MRRSVSRPLLYLAIIASLWAIQLFDSSTVIARMALSFLTLPWNIVLFYGLGVFGIELSALMSEQQSAVLFVASAMTQAALLSYFGARADRKLGVPVKSRALLVALACASMPAALTAGMYGMARIGDSRIAARAPAPPWATLSMSERQSRSAAALAVLLRAEFAWASAHPGGGYVSSLSTLAQGSPEVARAVNAIGAVGYDVKLKRREGHFGPVTSFEFDVRPKGSAPYAFGYYSDESGVIHSARVRESISAQSPLSHWPSQLAIAGFTSDGFAIVVRLGVRLLYVDAQAGSIRKTVIVPRDFVDIVLDSAGRPRMRTRDGVDSVGHMIPRRADGELWTANALGESQDFTQWESAANDVGQSANVAGSKRPWIEPGLVASAVSPDGKTVATLNQRGVLRTWDVTSGRAIGNWDLTRVRSER
jgi:hypothetical protein